MVYSVHKRFNGGRGGGGVGVSGGGRRGDNVLLFYGQCSWSLAANCSIRFHFSHSEVSDIMSVVSVLSLMLTVSRCDVSDVYRWCQ